MATPRLWRPLVAMVRVAIMIGTPQGSNLVEAQTEREAAATAEAVLRRLDPLALPVPVRVLCDDPKAAVRLSHYLAAVQADLVRG